MYNVIIWIRIIHSDLPIILISREMRILDFTIEIFGEILLCAKNIHVTFFF